MNSLHKTICGVIIVSLAVLASCTKKDGQTVVCTRTPSFPVYIPDDILKNSGTVTLYLVDTLTGTVADSMVINPSLKVSKLDNGKTVNQFDVNENERLFKQNSVEGKYYLVFADNTGKTDTIKNLTWQTTYPKAGCPIFNNFSFNFHGDTITDPYHDSFIYILE